MECEDVATLWRWIELVGKLRFDPGRFVRERQRLTPFRIDIEQAFAVFAGLFFYASKGVTFRFRFNGADCFSIYKQKVVDFVTALQKRFSNRDAKTAAEIDRPSILDLPTTFS